ncbi:MAG: YHYH protein [OCS116 cluster bacterium]|uniref:YHYH domain-containing protein n=1 Tax=OCS116 cluster bacterium TaxID=2030921 RepID=A0A2A4Z480_9PROT|nr:YHYH protein [OCS116 cluster bacterium]
MKDILKIGSLLLLSFGVQSCAVAEETVTTSNNATTGQKIAVGDGKISNSAKAGYVYSCQTRFNPNAPGAQASGDWIQGNYWYPDLKPSVDGDVKWSGGGLTVSVSGNTRKISSKNFPDHGTGIYPVQRTDDAYQFDRNPNSIKSQNIAINLPATPTLASSASCVPMGMVGVALTGAVFYNALDARGDDAVAHEIQDKCSGHPERNGQYHYHGPSDCMVEQAASGKHSGLIGYALDGFGIYGAKNAAGKIVTNADLDECHGHSETVTWDGVQTKIYHYHITAEYPYTLGCFRGKT